MREALGDRMKEAYEKRSRHYLTRKIPVIVRVDGRAFHTFTAGCEKPFDNHIANAMVHAAMVVAADISGFKLAYVQSDEASFLITDYDNLHTQAWFDYCHSKIVSVTASVMTSAFNDYYHFFQGLSKKRANFDSRAFTMPQTEVANYFLWRAQDWERNSVQMFARSFYSDKELHGKKTPEVHEMLHAKGANWATGVPARFKNGTFIIKNPITPNPLSLPVILSDRFLTFPNLTPRYPIINELIAPLIAEPKEGARNVDGSQDGPQQPDRTNGSPSPGAVPALPVPKAGS